MAKPNKKALARLAQRQGGYDQLRKKQGYVRPGSLNKHKGSR